MIARLMVVLSLVSPWVDLDWRIQDSIQSHRVSILEAPMRWASDVGRPQLVLGGLLALAVFGGPAGVETARYAILVMIPTNVIVELTKRATDRARPDGEHRKSNASFPSSHAANAFALAWVIRRRWSKAWPLLYATAILVAFSRIYLNRHFLTDVVCGAIVGLACAWMVGLVLDKATAKAPDLPPPTPG